MTASAGKSLYQRLGGYDVIANVVAGLHGRMSKDRQTWYYWMGRDTDRMATECRQFTDLVCAAAGKQGNSLNQCAKKPRMSLGISNVEWEHFVPLKWNFPDRH